MATQDRPLSDDQPAVEPAHPAPAQSPRSLGDDQLPQNDKARPDDKSQEEPGRLPPR